jgi:uncharacterized protein YndB with AHSA1/START domain
MSTHEEQRPLELEIEVPGTPEQVWAAIATGPGISSWIHPTTVEEREGGAFTFDMGMGPQSGTVTAWEPPHRFGEETAWGGGESMPTTTLATEWIVSARSGSTCVVRMVTSGFGTGGDWADEFDGFAESMTTSLQNLRLYLTHFAGQTGTWMKAYLPGHGDRHGTWSQLTSALGLADASVGQHVSTAGPGLTGTVEHAAEGRWRRDLLLRLERPAPGLAAVSVWGEVGMVLVQAVLFGDGADVVAAEQEGAWQEWLESQLGATAGAGARVGSGEST